MTDQPVRIGCSGWQYDDWRGRVYPRGTPPRRWLTHYATLFDTVEVNSTFYRIPPVEMTRSWVERTPRGFEFSVKLFQKLTRRHVQIERQANYTGQPSEVFELRPHFEWRGLGFIAHSALRMREEYAAYDAERRFPVPGVRVADPKACQCGEVLKGVLKPWECKVFGTACTPETPIGTCMVSPEGACAAYYNFGRFTRERVKEATRS